MLEKIGMAMVNPLVNLANVKDSQWLTLEVCREFQRNKCSRTDQECRYAHPPPHVEVQNGRVTACFDSIKGKCQRKDPPCKYLHPPQHLKEILLQNGKNNLYWKNRLQAMAQAQAYPYVPTPGIIPTVVPSYLYPQQIDVGPSVPKAVPYPAIVPGQYPVMHPFMPSIHAASGIPFNPYFSGIPMPTTMGLPGSASDGSLVAQQAVPGMMPVPMAAAAGAIQQQKAIRPDRLETSMTGLSPYAKRLAVTDNKSGVPMYQPSMAAYQHALAVQPYLQAAPFQLGMNECGIQSNPIAFVQTTGADSTMPAYTSLAFTGHHSSLSRF